MRILYRQNKSDGKIQEPYDFTHIWDIKLKAANEQMRQQTKTQTQRRAWWLPEEKECGEAKGVKDTVTKRDLTWCCVHTMQYTDDYYGTVFFKAI